MNTYYIKYISLLCFFSIINSSYAQTILSISTPTPPGNYFARDKVVALPGSKFTPDSRLYLDKNIIAPIGVNGNPYGGFSINSVYTIDKNLPVGIINGNYSVNNGQVSYNIPISVAPGTAGFLPSLGISYSSTGGDGLVGEGWNISGISMIKRIPKDYFHSFQTATSSTPSSPITLTNLDLFSLDGNLITQGFGLASGVRRLENDNFTEVKSIGNGGDYTSFEVTTKDGIFMEYGTTLNSKQFITHPTNFVSVPLTYYLTKVTDKNGNYYTYEYHNINGEIAIKEIKYTGNTVAGITPYNSIKFYYDSREDQNTSYFQGNILKNTLILREVELFCEGVSYKKIVPKYEYINDKSFLSSITEYAADNKPLNPTKFSYDNILFTPTPNLSVGNIGLPTLPPLSDLSMGDYNGDGKTDVMAYKYSSIDPILGIKLYTGWELYINQNNGTNYVMVASDNSGNFYPYSSNGRITEFNTEAVGTLTGDLNGDEKPDILLLQNNAGNTIYKPYYSNFNGNSGSFVAGTTFILPTISQVKLADVDGDRIPELISYGAFGSGSSQFSIHNFQTGTNQTMNTDPANNTSLGGPSSVFKILQILDFDQDGTKELLVEISGKARVIKINNYNKYQTSYPPNYTLTKLGQDDMLPLTGFILHYGDFNGDGITDRITQGITSAQMLLHYGTSKQNNTTQTFFASSPISLASILPKSSDIMQKILIADMDNDGRSDIITLISSNTPIYGTPLIEMKIAFGKNITNNINIGNVTGYYKFPNGIDFANPPSTYQTNGHYNQEFCFGDFDGNGYTDIMLKTVSGNQYLGVRLIIYNSPLRTDNKLSKVTNGFGRDVKFIYKTLANNSVYTKGTGGVYPIIDLQAPISLVSKVIMQDANDNYYDIDYTYSDAKMHMTGKGFLGFGSVSVTNNLLQTKTITIYNLFNLPTQNPSRYPILSKTFLLSNLTTPVKEILTNYSYVKSFAAATQPYNYYVKINDVTEIDYLYGTNILKNYIYDNYNNVTSMITNINSGYQINTIVNEIDFNLYGNKYPSYIKSVTSSQTRTGESLITKLVKYGYTSTGLLQIATNNFGSPCENNSTYVYNATGVLINTTANTAGNDPRLTSMLYDSKSRFVIKNTNPLGYIKQSTFDNRFGRPLSETDIDNLSTSYTYDGFGRNTSVTTPDNNTVYFNQKWYDAADEISLDPYPSSKSLIITEVIASNNPTQKTFITASGLNIKTSSEGFNNNYVSNLNTFNNKGQLENSRANYLIPCPNPAIVLLTSKTYDVYNREIHTSTSDGIDNLITSTNYLPHSGGNSTAIVTSPDGKTKTTTIDPIGLTKSVTDNLGSTLTYNYYSNGQTKDISLLGNIVLSNTYDDCDNLKSQFEPNYDVSNYAYDGFGQLVSSTNNSKTYTYSYDLLGRLITCNQPSGIIYNYIYRVANGGKGMIEQESVSTGASKKYYYDYLGRTTKIEEIVSGQTFATQMQYDLYSNPIKYTYPSGFAIKTSYDNFGFQTTIKNDATGALLWQADEINSFGQYTKYTLGNGNIQTVKDYDNFGYLTNETAGSIFNHSYNFNKQNGNLNYINDNIKGLNESFEYTDNLNRLNKSTVNDLTTMLPIATPLSIAYDANGNIKSKSDVGRYKYLNTKPNAVQFIENTYNVIPSAQQDITYNAFEQPVNINEGDEDAVITYGVDRERIKATYSNAATLQSYTRYYLNNFDKEVNGSITREIHYLQAPGGLVGMHVIENGIENTYFVYSDHLGTPKTITNASGSVIFEQNFDAWGQKRNPNTLNYTSIPVSPNWLIRGFTGHEHLPQFSLINMNGRLYDPQNARMLSPDPILQDPTNTQNHNKYSYALNNPLKYTDPSGNWVPGIPIVYAGLALFVIGDILDHQLNRFPGGEYENETVGQGFVNGAKHGLYAYEQVMSMTQYKVAEGKSGDFSYSLNVGFSFGSSGLGIMSFGSVTYRHHFDNGNYLDLSVSTSVGRNYGSSTSQSPTLFQNSSSVAGGFEFGNSEFHGGLYSTTYFSGESSQRVGGLNFGGKYWGLNYENDGAIPFANLGLGDGGDNDRTAALRFRYKEYSAGFNLMTEKRDGKFNSKKNEMEYKTIDGSYKGKSSGLGRQDIYQTQPSGRLGALYVGYGNHYAGFNSDAVRSKIQNDWIHNAVNSPHFINSSYGVLPYGGYWPTKKFSLW